MQEAAKGLLRWSSNQAATYVLYYKTGWNKEKKHPVTKPENKIILKERILNCFIKIYTNVKT